MKKLLFVLAFLLVPIMATAQVQPKMEFYHGKECPHCHKQHKWLPELEALYPDLKIEIYEVWHDEANAKKMQDRLAELGKESNGVPTNIIEGDVLVGFNPDGILETLEKHYGPPTGEVVDKTDDEDSDDEGLSWWGKLIRWFKNLF